MYLMMLVHTAQRFCVKTQSHLAIISQNVCSNHLRHCRLGAAFAPVPIFSNGLMQSTYRLAKDATRPLRICQPTATFYGEGRLVEASINIILTWICQTGQIHYITSIFRNNFLHFRRITREQ